MVLPLYASQGETRIEDGHDLRFSIDDLQSCPNQTSSWDGVRNVVASRHLASMRPGDQCIFYHSNCKVPGCVALVTVVSEPFADHTAFDSADPHYDRRSDPACPKWKMVRRPFASQSSAFVILVKSTKSSLHSTFSSGRCKVRASLATNGVASRTKTPLLAAKIRAGKRCVVSSGEAVRVSFDRRGI